MLLKLEDRNCLALAESIGRPLPEPPAALPGPGILRPRRRHGASIGDLAVARLADPAEPAVLVTDETGDEKSSTTAVGAAHQYSGALGGVALGQVAVHLTYATARGHALIDRALPGGPLLPPSTRRQFSGELAGTGLP